MGTLQATPEAVVKLARPSLMSSILEKSQIIIQLQQLSERDVMVTEKSFGPLLQRASEGLWCKW